MSEQLYKYLKAHGALSESVSLDAFSVTMQDKSKRQELFQYMRDNDMLTQTTDFFDFDKKSFGDGLLSDLRMGKTELAPDVAQEQPPRDNIIQAVGKELGNVPERFMQAAGGLAQSIGETEYDSPEVQGQIAALTGGRVMSKSDMIERAQGVAWETKVPKDVAQHDVDLAAWGENLRRKAQSTIQTPNVEPGSPAYYAGAATGSIAQMIPALVAGVLTRNPTVSMGIIGAQVKGTSYGEGREAGLTPEQAQLYSTAQALAEAIPEALPLGVYLKEGGKLLSKVVKGTAAEVIQEEITEALQIGLDKGYISPDMTWGEVLTRLKDAGIIAAISGPVYGSATHGMQKLVESPSPGRQVADAINSQVDNATPLPQQPAPSVQQGQAPSMRDMLEAELNKKGYTIQQVRENLAGALGVQPIQQESQVNLPNQPVKVPETGSEQQVKTPILDPVISRETAAADVVTPEQGVGEAQTPENLPETRSDLLPEDWTMEVGRTRTKEGHTFEAEVDWKGRRVVFSEKKHMDNPEIVNHEIAHVFIESLPEKEGLFTEYVEAKKGEWESKGYEADWIVKNHFHREEIAMEYGDYLSGKPVPENIKAVFEKHLPTQKLQEQAQEVQSSANNPVAVVDDTDVQAASQQVDTSPTEAQKEAGNYKKGHVRLHGLDITIENPKGSERTGTDKGGKQWSVTMRHTYGYFKRTEGKDGDQVDVFIGDNPSSTNVYVIDQVVDGKFDEHKVMMGFPSMEEARQGYLSNYEKGWDGLGNITEMSVDQFKDWLKNGSQKKPVSLKKTGILSSAASSQGAFGSNESGLRQAETFAEARLAVQDFKGKPLTNRKTGMIATVSGKGLKKMLNESAVKKSENPVLHSFVVANIDKFFEQAIYGWQKPDRGSDPNIASIHRFFVGFRYGKESRLAKITVKEHVQKNQGNKIYTVEAIDLNKKVPSREWTDATIKADGLDPTSILHAGDIYNLANAVENNKFLQKPRKKTLSSPPQSTLPARFSPGENYVSMYQAGGIGVPDRPKSGKITVAGREIKLKPEDNPTRVESIRQQVKEIVGPRLYAGKVKGKTRLGFYRQDNTEIRTRHYHDVEVLAHEMAHFLGEYKKDKRFNEAYHDGKYTEELAGVSYTSDPDSILAEGFAEYVRLWLTQYDNAVKTAPNFTQRFESILADDKKLQKRMQFLQDDMHRWYNQGPLAQLEAVTGGNNYTLKEKLTAFVAQHPLSLMRQQYVDNIHAAKVITSDVAGGLRDATADPYKQLQLINGVEGIVQESFLHGAPSFDKSGDIKFKGPSLEQVWKESLKKGMKTVRAQELYFAARRGQELKAQKRENLMSKQMIDAGLELVNRYPWFEKSFFDYQKYNRNLRTFMVECGYVEEAAAEAWAEANKAYVPFNREVEGIGQAFAGSGNLKRLKGGTQNVKHIYDNILLSNANHIKGALRARAMRQLYSEALQSPEGGKYIAALGPDAKKAVSSVEQQAKTVARVMSELELALSKDGMILTEATEGQITDVDDIENVLKDNPELLQFWTFGHAPNTAETGVDSFIDPKTGKRQYVEIQKENELLLDMLNNMSGTKYPDGILGLSLRLAEAIKRFQTLTVTAAWQFAGPNVVRDIQQASVLSGGKFRPIVDNVYGVSAMLHDLLKREGWYHEMKSQGGGWSGRVRSIMTDSWQLQQGPMVPKLRSKLHPVSMGQQLVDVLMSVGDFAEMSTRVGFYIRQRKSGVSARESAWQAREISTDFRKHGSYAPWVLTQRMAPFLGAYVQSMDRDIRAIAETDGKISVKNLAKIDNAKARIYAVGGSMIAAGIAVALMNSDDERYKDLTPDQKTRFFHFFIGDHHITIPKAHGFFSLMMNAGEAIVDKLKGQDGEDVGNYLSFAIMYQLGADIMPGFADPIVELAVNKSFTGAPIIQRRLEGIEGRYQFSDRTPSLYLNIGQSMGISPDAVQHLVRGYTGYVSDFLNEASEAVLWNEEQWGERPFAKDAGSFIGKQFVQKKVPYRTKWTEKYYNTRKQAEEKAATLSYLQKAPVLRDKKLLEGFVAKEENLRLSALKEAFASVDKALADQEMHIAAIKYNKELSAEEKEKRIDEYYDAKNRTLKKAAQQIESVLKR